MERPVGPSGPDILAPKQSLDGIWEVGDEMVGARVGDGLYWLDYCKGVPTRSTLGEVGGDPYEVITLGHWEQICLIVSPAAGGSKPTRIHHDAQLLKAASSHIFWRLPHVLGICQYVPAYASICQHMLAHDNTC